MYKRQHHGGVGVLAIIDNKILLVKQYRYPNATDTLEIPAGKLELGEDTKPVSYTHLISFLKLFYADYPDNY